MRDRPWHLGDDPTCAVCGLDILPADAVVRPLNPADATGQVAHVTCTKEGVERWCRENRPEPDPLLWDRAERPRWHRLETADGRQLRVVRQVGRGDTRRMEARAVGGYTRR